MLSLILDLYTVCGNYIWNIVFMLNLIEVPKQMYIIFKFYIYSIDVYVLEFIWILFVRYHPTTHLVPTSNLL